MNKMSDILIQELENINSFSKKKSYDKIRKYITIYKLKNFNLLESSGTNVVILSSDVHFVIQIYNTKELFTRIHYLILDIITNPFIYMPITSNKKNDPKYIYDAREFVVQSLRFNQNTNTIFWEKIKPLNSFSKEDLVKIIHKNKEKLIWDISKALHVFHTNGYIHGDCTIDNIGISAIGNFVLFDFDASVKLEKHNCFVDFSTLFKSLYFHTDNIFFKNFYLECEFFFGVTLLDKVLCENTIVELEKLTIVYQ